MHVLDYQRTNTLGIYYDMTLRVVLVGGASLGSDLGCWKDPIPCVKSRGADNTTPRHTAEAKGDYTSKKGPFYHFLPSPSSPFWHKYEIYA